MKSIYSFNFLICVALLMPTLSVGASEPGVPDYITSAQQDALKAWLSAHPEFRVATDKDCECADNIASIRNGYGGVWKANPNYHPYFASGDFSTETMKTISPSYSLSMEEDQALFGNLQRPIHNRHRTSLSFSCRGSPVLWRPPSQTLSSHNRCV